MRWKDRTKIATGFQLEMRSCAFLCLLQCFMVDFSAFPEIGVPCNFYCIQILIRAELPSPSRSPIAACCLPVADRSLLMADSESETEPETEAGSESEPESDC